MSSDRQRRISASTLRNLIRLDNDDTDTFTCVGFAPSKSRRCQCLIAKANQDIAESIVRSLPGLLGDHAALQCQLRELATRALCVQWHREQAHKVSRDWYFRIVEELRHRNATPTPAHNRRQSQALPPAAPPQRTPESITLSSTLTLTSAISLTTTDSTQPGISTLDRIMALANEIATATTSPFARAEIEVDQTILSDPVIEPSATDHPASATQTNASTRSDEVTQADSRTAASPGTEARAAPQDARHHEHAHDTLQPPTVTSSEDDTCYICYLPYDDPHRTPCGHTFCRECISQWLGNNSTCPYDRRRLLLEDLVAVQPVVEEQTSCIICFEECNEPSRTPCGHVFCRGCITQWLRNGTQRVCPYDRRPLEEEDLVLVGAAQA